MGLVVRYFSDNPAGTEDGTSYANRAPLYLPALNPIITGHNFGVDSLLCLIEGAHSGNFFTTSNFTTPPTKARPLIFRAAPGGTQWEPPNKYWSSAQPIWDTTGMFEINNPSVLIFDLPHTHVIGGILKSGSSANWLVVHGSLSWCHLIQTGTAANGNAAKSVNNCVISSTGTTWNRLGTYSNGYEYYNTRFEGSTSATTGNRRGLDCASNVIKTLKRCTFLNTVGHALWLSGTKTIAKMDLTDCSFINCGTAVTWAATAAEGSNFQDCLFHNCTTGIAGTVGDCFSNNLMNSVTTPWGGLSHHYPVAEFNFVDTVSAGDLFVNSSSGDYRIKLGSPYFGKNLGAGDELDIDRNYVG